MRAGDGAQNSENKEHACQVESPHQLRQQQQASDAICPDGESHGAERADGCGFHDQVDHREQNLRHLFNKVKNRVLSGAELLQRNPEHHRQQQYLQDLALGERVKECCRDDAEQEILNPSHFPGSGIGGNRTGVQFLHIDVHAHARPNNINDHQAEDQREGTHHFEIKQRQPAGSPHLLQIFRSGDAQHHRAEDDGGDDHLDQLDERIAPWLHRRPRGWGEEAEQYAAHNRYQDLEIQRSEMRLVNHLRASHEKLSGYRYEPGLPIVVPAGDGAGEHVGVHQYDGSHQQSENHAVNNHGAQQ